MKNIIIFASLFAVLFSLNAQNLSQKILIDFGPNDVTNGNVTLSPDANGIYWNNVVNSTISAPISLLVNTSNISTGFGLNITSSMLSNGILNGGLLSPNVAQLGELAINTATQDYFFTDTKGGIKLSGLNPTRRYKLYFFGSRNMNETRVTQLSIIGNTTTIGTLQTSGNNLGGVGYHGNNSTVFSTGLISPNANGTFLIDIIRKTGTYAHLNILKIEEFDNASIINVTGISLTGNDISISGASSQLTANMTPTNASNKDLTWSVDNNAIASISISGILKPKMNGQVTVTATSKSNPSISATKLISITNQITTMYFSGTATENGDNVSTAIPMLTRKDAQGNLTNIFELYTSINSTGTFKFYTSTSPNSPNYGLGNSAGTIALNGSVISSVGAGTVLISLDLNTNSYSILPISKWSVVGNTILNAWNGDMPLNYQGNGIWSGTVSMHTSTAEIPAFHFKANGSESYVLKRIQGTINSVMLESQASNSAISVENIGLPYGTYNIKLDLQKYTYSAVCSSTDNVKITVMGSSVANGQGASSMQGYNYLFNQILSQRAATGKGLAWNMANASVNGNSTLNLLERWEKDLIPQCGKYVIYGLSLGNEGVHENGQASFDQFKTNMLRLIEMARERGMVPVLTNNYTRADFNLTDYSFIKQMDLLIHEWDIPSVNMLGAIDDGSGRWPVNYESDSYHPNDAGHAEFSYAFVPSLFDALEAGKPQPKRISGTYLTLGKLASLDQLVFAPENKIHPFTVSFDIKTTSYGTIASFKQEAAKGTLSIDESTGCILYNSPNLKTIIGQAIVNDGKWHKISFTHFYARGETILYIDDLIAGKISEKLLVEEFYFSDVNAPSSIDYKELFFFRSGMNIDEIKALNNGKMMKSSLELYAPLDGQAIIGVNPLINLAQSTNTITKRPLFTAINGQNQQPCFRIHPIPVLDTLTIDGLKDARKYECVVYGLDGQEMIRKSMNNNKVNLSMLVPSSYVLVLNDMLSSSQISFKFTKVP